MLFVSVRIVFVFVMVFNKLGPSASKPRLVDYAKFQKWKREYDRDLSTVVWLNCSTKTERGKRVVTHLLCIVCQEFEGRLKGKKHFSSKWIRGAESIRCTSLRDHAKSDQHVEAMRLKKRSLSIDEGVTSSSSSSTNFWKYCSIRPQTALCGAGTVFDSSGRPSWFWYVTSYLWPRIMRCSVPI